MLFPAGRLERLAGLAGAAISLACAFGTAAHADDLNNIDIAVGYTREALHAFQNDRSRLEAHLLAYRNRTNAILEASGAPVRLNILAIEAAADFRQSTFAADRQRFIQGREGGEAIEQLRDRVGADVRLLLVNYRGRGARVHYGGIFDAGRTRPEALKNAYVMIGTNADEMTFAHEIGHVLGCQHARRRPCLGAREGGLPFAYGFRSREGVGTIMAGSCATTELVPLYSSPALEHRYTVGESAGEKVIRLGSDTADCVRAMTNNAPVLAALNERKSEPLDDRPDDAPLVADLAADRAADGDAATARNEGSVPAR
jgi:hypothetical protein